MDEGKREEEHEKGVRKREGRAKEEVERKIYSQCGNAREGKAGNV